MAGAPVRQAERGLIDARLLVSALIAAIGLFFFVLAAGAHLQLQEARGLMQGGKTGEATITEVLGGGGRGGSHRYSYGFLVGADRFAQARRDITYDARYGTKVGDRVKVWYDPRDPSKSITRAELDELESWPNRLFFPLAGFALLAWAIARVIRRPPS
jgi:hypothetical protein